MTEYSNIYKTFWSTLLVFRKKDPCEERQDALIEKVVSYFDVSLLVFL